MPFSSKAQARFMFAVHPKLAKEFAEKTKSIKALPEHVRGGDGKYRKRQPHAPKMK